MVVKKIVVKVSIVCVKCKTSVMKAVAKLEGINSMAVDSDKATLTVIGTVDPVLIVKQLRKSCIGAEIVSVGEEKKEEKKEEKEDDKKPLPPCCSACKPVAMAYVTYDNEPSFCTIL